MFHPFFTSLLNSHIVVIYFTALPVFFTLSLHDALPIFGLVFDGDADRCFFIDETGATMSASAIGALVAEREIARAKAAGDERPTVIHNLITSRSVPETITAAGGRPLRSKVGHSGIKAQIGRAHV